MSDDRRGWAAGVLVLVILISAAWWLATSQSSSGPRESPLPTARVDDVDDVDSSKAEPAPESSDEPRPDDSRESIPGARALRGRVWSRITHRPVTEARVTLVRDRTSRDPVAEPTRTDADGRFTIPNPPDSARLLVVRGRGHASRALQIGPSAGRPEGLEVEVWLEAASQVAGVVVDSSGVPVAQARLSVAPVGEPATLSDAEGRFVLQGLGKGLVELWAYHPDVGVATRRDIPAGTGDVVLKLEGPLLSVQGMVIDDVTERPVSRAQVWVDDLRLFGCTGETDDDGRFRLEGIPPEPFRIGASSPSHGPTLVLVEASGQEVVIRLRAPEPVEGTVVERATGDLLPGVELRIEAGSVRWSGRTDSAGHFRSDVSFPFGRIEVSMVEESDWVILASSVVDGRSPSIEWSTKQPIRIVVSRGARVEGTVLGLESTPISSCPVILMSVTADLFAESVAWSWTDELGRFELGPVAEPGKHRVIARPARVGPAFSDPFDLRPGGHVRGVTLTAEPAGRLSGRLIDRDRQPVSGTTLTLERVDGVALEPIREDLQTSTASDGRFTLGPVPSGSYRVLAANSTTPEQVVAEPWLVESEVQSDIVWVFDRGARLELRILDQWGEPLSGARVALIAVREGTILVDADRDGRLAVDGLQPGPVTVRVLADAEWDDLETERTAGAPAEDLIVPRRQTVGARGRLLLEDGRPARGVLWVRGVREDREVWRSEELREGDFAFSLNPGRWRLLLVVAGQGSVVIESVVVAADEATELGELSLADSRDAEGTVVDGAGAPVSAAVVVATLDGDQFGGPPVGRAVTDDAGRFGLPGLGGLPLELKVQAEGFGPRFFTSRGQPELGRLTIEAGGTVSVQVNDSEGRPVPDEIVLLGPFDEAARSGSTETRLARSDESGHAQFEHVTPGRYRIQGALWLRGPGRIQVHEGGETLVELVRIRR